ncbi:hypothetical protein SS50377_22498 [Spironucleus salmonicida]|uniref:Uncharacterized protein n=1 Tax=Spironucleus salmonicida TaxID=348837 RepID=V6LE91_9EUKA|nr:hypothetical protein SS50377_22498 [Spironucleus salmonicida]|eukprot:EST42011.1 Hypothetical protein SS50377_18317 [Spironucleus salmonicida]
MLPVNPVINHDELKSAFKEQFDIFSFKFQSQHPLDRVATKKFIPDPPRQISQQATKFGGERKTVFEKIINNQKNMSQSIGYLNPYHNKIYHVSKDTPDLIPTPRQTYVDKIVTYSDAYQKLPELRSQFCTKINCQERTMPEPFSLTRRKKYKYVVKYDPKLEFSGKFSFSKSMNLSLSSIQ